MPWLAAAEGLFLFDVKKKQKTPAENFSFEASGMALSVGHEKFIRPDLSRTEIWCYGLAIRKHINSTSCSLTNNCEITSMEAQRRIFILKDPLMQCFFGFKYLLQSSMIIKKARRSNKIYAVYFQPCLHSVNSVPSLSVLCGKKIVRYNQKISLC